MIFIDTSAWVAIEDRKDRNWKAAISFKDQLARERRGLVTSNYVLDETYTLLLLNVGYVRTVGFKRKLDSLRRYGILKVFWVDKEIEQAAQEIFERFNRDKEWSFTDCTSKAIMEREGIREVFAFDRHFDQMGFIRRP